VNNERRQFPRLHLTENTYAVDANGRELGKVSEASGGGMLIRVADEKHGLNVGDRVQLSVLEPKSQTSNTIDVLVRYVKGNEVGVEFVTGG